MYMPRRTSFKKKTNLPAKKTQTQVINQQPTMMGSIGQGMSIGAGAAIGSSMVHGAMDAFSGGESKQVEQKNTKNFECDNLLEQFKDCSKNYEDLNTCKPFLHFYTTCLNSNPSM